MTIILTKYENKARLCIQQSGSDNAEFDLGYPHHDIAHYVVEKEFNMKAGFYGNLKSGYTPAQLNDKEIIKTLPAESWISELMSRTLQGLQNGSCKKDQFIEQIQWEAAETNIGIPDIHPVQIDKMLSKFNDLLKRWEQLKNGESLSLNFD